MPRNGPSSEPKDGFLRISWRNAIWTEDGESVGFALRRLTAAWLATPTSQSRERSLRATMSLPIVSCLGAVAGLVGNEGGVVSEVINLESSGVGAPDRRPRHDED